MFARAPETPGRSDAPIFSRIRDGSRPARARDIRSELRPGLNDVKPGAFVRHHFDCLTVSVNSGVPPPVIPLATWLGA